MKTAEQRLDERLTRMDEENDYFDGEEGIRLNHAKSVVQGLMRRVEFSDLVEYARLKEELSLIEQRYEALDEIYK